MRAQNSAFARRSFRWAAIYGCLVLAPLYGLERQVGVAGTPITHPEYYYGFIGTALAAQIMFLVIASDPDRYRPAMLAAIAEKLAFGVPAWLLWLDGRTAGTIVAFGSIDLVWAAVFCACYLRTPDTHRPPSGPPPAGRR